MRNLFRQLNSRWHTSMVFKLGAVALAILFLTLLAQSFASLQTYRLTGALNSILVRSVPLLENSQEFARVTSKTLSHTSVLGENLSKEELETLQVINLEHEAESDKIFSDIVSAFFETNNTAKFEVSRGEFAATNKKLFDNQLNQRELEEDLQRSTEMLQWEVTKFKSQVDLLILQSTSEILLISSHLQPDAPIPHQGIDRFLVFADEVEILNGLKGDINDISIMLQSVPDLLNETELTASLDRFRLRVRDIAQSLILLHETDTRADLAKLILGISTEISSDIGYFNQLMRLAKLKQDFNVLKRDQASKVDAIDFRVEQIVKEATDLFSSDISLAGRLTRMISWIGISAAIFVVSVILLLNKYVIRAQISDRFVILTEDVLAISKGDYRYQIRVTGEDELGDIARALNVFRAQAEELKRSNAELERFAYVAAHDLRSPLDAIQDLARWTLEDERQNLSESCIANLELLIRRSSRLSSLQADLLTYAQVGEIDTSEKPVHLGDEVSRLSDMLDPDNRFNIYLKNDPGTIVTNSVPVRQILLNLITNAIKHHDRLQGQITVTFKRESGRYIFSVQDDGPGIEFRYQKKIFELFKTLQSRDKIEGSGLGLALVAKLMNRLEGRILVESDAPTIRGSTFIFDVPDLSYKLSRELAA